MKVVKNYPKYKIASQSWMGQIPDHWEVKKVKYLFSIRKEIAGKLGYHVLSITQSGIKIKDVDSGVGQLAMDYSKYQMVDVGDFAMNHMDLLTGYVDISKYNGVISPDYRVFKLTNKNSVDRYFLYFLQYCYRNRIFYALGQGSSQLGRWRLAAEEFNTFEFPLPARDEQTAIVNYLDGKIKEIKKLIALKERTIELLRERRIVIISQAIIMGLDSSVKMKDSGIGWLGSIPTHWKVKKLKFLLRQKLKYGANESAELDDTSLPRYIRITDFGDDGVLKENTFKSLPNAIAQDYLLNEGDILFARSGGTVGKTFQFKNYRGLACFAGYLIKATCSDEILSDFLYSYTKTSAYEQWKDTMFNQATIQNIGADKYSTLPVPVPPIDEQKRICHFVLDTTNEFDRVISRIKAEIDLIKTYSESMIHEAITGKIDVRNKILDNG